MITPERDVYIPQAFHLAFPADVPQGQQRVAVIAGYFDESGTHAGSEAVAVAGYIAAPEVWVAFERDWLTALGHQGLTAFRMSKFANRAGDFTQWERERREEFLLEITSIIKRHAFAATGVVLPKKVFEEEYDSNAKRFFGGTYGLAGFLCMADIAKRLKGTGFEVAYIFESGARGAGALLRHFQKPFIRENLQAVSLRFESKQRFAPLQAADILAYELYRKYTNTLGGWERNRHEYDALLEDMPAALWQGDRTFLNALRESGRHLFDAKTS